MTVEIDSQRKYLLIAMSLLILGSIVLLVPWVGFFPHISVLPRIVLVGFLLIGLAGAVSRSGVFLVVGKIGVWGFILYGVAGLQDPEDLPYSSHFKYGIASVEFRFVLFLSVAVALLLCFGRLGRLYRPGA